MKLLVLSDLHLECGDLQLPASLDFDIALLAGDIGNPPSRVLRWLQDSPLLRGARAVVWVPGNHEYFDSTLHVQAARMKALAAACRQPSVHLLDGDGVVIDGVRFLGCILWTDFALRIDTAQGSVCDVERGMAAARRGMVDYRAIDVADGVAGVDTVQALRKLRPQDSAAMHRSQRAWLEQALAAPFAGRTVVLTHHGPHRESLAARFAADWVSTAFINELPEAFFRVPSLWVHGHTHTSFDYRLGACRVVCNPRGYSRAGSPPENQAFDPGCIVELV